MSLSVVTPIGGLRRPNDSARPELQLRTGFTDREDRSVCQARLRQLQWSERQRAESEGPR